MMTPKRMESPRPTKTAKPTGTVRVASVLLMMSGQKKFVPTADESEDGDGSDDRLAERDEDAPKQTEAAAAVQAPGFLQLDRDSQEELRHQEDAEGMAAAGTAMLK